MELGAIHPPRPHRAGDRDGIIADGKGAFSAVFAVVDVYYVHSYYGKNCTESTLAVSDYSIPVTGVVRAGRVYGTQFHPEKSGAAGARILLNFLDL